jgi:hypothetical protein
MRYPRPAIAWVFQPVVFVMLPAGVAGLAVDPLAEGEPASAIEGLAAGVDERDGTGALLHAATIATAEPSTRSFRQATGEVEMRRR